MSGAGKFLVPGVCAQVGERTAWLIPAFHVPGEEDGYFYDSETGEPVVSGTVMDGCDADALYEAAVKALPGLPAEDLKALILNMAQRLYPLRQHVVGSPARVSRDDAYVILVVRDEVLRVMPQPPYAKEG